MKTIDKRNGTVVVSPTVERRGRMISVPDWLSWDEQMRHLCILNIRICMYNFSYHIQSMHSLEFNCLVWNYVFLICYANIIYINVVCIWPFIWLWWNFGDLFCERPRKFLNKKQLFFLSVAMKRAPSTAISNK